MRTRKNVQIKLKTNINTYAKKKSNSDKKRSCGMKKYYRREALLKETNQ